MSEFLSTLISALKGMGFLFFGFLIALGIVAVASTLLGYAIVVFFYAILMFGNNPKALKIVGAVAIFVAAANLIGRY